MTDRDVDMVRLVVRLGDREQCRDRPALNDGEIVVDQAPLDVLGTPEVRLDPPAQRREPNDVRVAHGRPLPQVSGECVLLNSA